MFLLTNTRPDLFKHKREVVISDLDKLSEEDLMKKLFEGATPEEAEELRDMLNSAAEVSKN